jgi:hypothetical protein
MIVPSSGKRRERKHLLLVAGASFAVGCFLGGNLNLFAPSGGTGNSRSDKLLSNSASLTLAGSSSDSSNSRDYGNGWHSIEVFYGKTNHFERNLDKNQVWYGQVRQDEAVYKLFRKKRNGFFVDLAANDGIGSSNSYSLEKRFGWTGLCIEPNPIYWSNLSYRSCQVVAAVAGKTRMKEVFFRFGGGPLGGIAAEGFDNGEDSQKDSEPRYTVTLREIFERFNAPKVIDYLSLDVEGAEGYIMESFPLSDYKVLVMTIERPKDPLRALLGRNGYKHLKDMSEWGETIWAHESIVESLDLTYINAFEIKK